MNVGDVMTRGVISVSPADTMQKAAQMMLQYDLSGLPVLEQGRLVGIITEGDFLRRSAAGEEQRGPRWIEFLASPEQLAHEFTDAYRRTVRDVMTRNVITIDPDEPLSEAVRLMEQHSVKRLPVVRGEAIVGILSRANLLHAFLSAASGR